MNLNRDLKGWELYTCQLYFKLRRPDGNIIVLSIQDFIGYQEILVTREILVSNNYVEVPLQLLYDLLQFSNSVEELRVSVRDRRLQIDFLKSCVN